VREIFIYIFHDFKIHLIQKDMWQIHLWTLEFCIYSYFIHWKYNSTANVSACLTGHTCLPTKTRHTEGKLHSEN